jgi:hypothetical protein
VPDEFDVRQLIAHGWDELSTGTDNPASWDDDVTVTGAAGHLLSHLRAEDTAVAAVALAVVAARLLHRSRGALSYRLELDRSDVSAAVRSERYFIRRGRPAGASFAPLSRFWPTADGWVRTHANYPWHKAALLRALNVPDDPEEVERTMRRSDAEDIEERVFRAGGVAAAVRTLAQWEAHPQGRSVCAEPLVSHEVLWGAAPRWARMGRSPAPGYAFSISRG